LASLQKWRHETGFGDAEAIGMTDDLSPTNHLQTGTWTQCCDPLQNVGIAAAKPVVVRWSQSTLTSVARQFGAVEAWRLAIEEAQDRKARCRTNAAGRRPWSPERPDDRAEKPQQLTDR
jgi:hypothetical protein